MGDKSKISWTDALSPVSLYMTTATQGNYIEPMGFLITVVMVVMRCIFATIFTLQGICLDHVPFLDFITDRAGCLRLKFFTWGKVFSVPANCYAVTVAAFCLQSIPSVFIVCESRY